MTSTPIPRDIPLPMPANPVFLEVLLVVAFIAHILFVNLLVGGTLLTLGLQIRGLKRPDFDRLAHELALTVTVNKSLAVVLGVAPLLLINVLYTVHFYTANALTGTAWILLIPAIAATFLLLYLHKYSWDKLANHRHVHLAILGLAAALLLVIPMVFLANVNLMMFPEHWSSVRGFLSALSLPNVLPRYFHFICASLIVTSLFSVYYFGREKYDETAHFESLTKEQIRKTFYAVAFAVSLVQFVVGPLVLFTLPSRGIQWPMLLSILGGAVVALPAVWLIWLELTSERTSRRRYSQIVSLLTLTVVCMALGRHVYRQTALADHRQQMRQYTAQWQDDAAQAAYDLKSGVARAQSGVTEGQHLFETTCAACHAQDKVLVGPSLVEIASIYADNPQGIVTWAKAPGKKRANVPQMPPFAALGDAKLAEVAKYMLAQKVNAP